jgi:parvulin-like peptidyl-prolyl isomerase
MRFHRSAGARVFVLEPALAASLAAFAFATVLTGALAVRGQQAASSHDIQIRATGRPVARVNGTVLTDGDLLREMFAIFPYARQHDGGFPKELEEGIRDGALKMIIFEELVYQEALRRGMNVSAPKLDKAEADFRAQFANADLYREFVHADFHDSEELVRARVRRSLLIDALLKIEVERKSEVSNAELRSYYDENPRRFEHAESFAFQTISVLPPTTPTAAQMKEGRRRAEDALRQARATKTYEEFGMLAEKISDDDYRVMMGDHKFVERAKLDPAVVHALLALQPGQITGVIQIEQAFTIVRLNGHTPAGKSKFEDVKVDLRKELEAKKTNRLRAALDQSLRRKATIEVL